AGGRGGAAIAFRARRAPRPQQQRAVPHARLPRAPRIHHTRWIVGAIQPDPEAVLARAYAFPDREAAACRAPADAGAHGNGAGVMPPHRARSRTTAGAGPGGESGAGAGVDRTRLGV